MSQVKFLTSLRPTGSAIREGVTVDIAFTVVPGKQVEADANIDTETNVDYTFKPIKYALKHCRVECNKHK